MYLLGFESQDERAARPPVDVHHNPNILWHERLIFRHPFVPGAFLNADPMALLFYPVYVSLDLDTCTVFQLPSNLQHRDVIGIKSMRLCLSPYISL
jgi:hypothetical protein